MIVVLRKTAEEHKREALANLDRIWRERRLWIYLYGFTLCTLPLTVAIVSLMLRFWFPLVICVPMAVLFFFLGVWDNRKARKEHLVLCQEVIDMWAGPIEGDRLLDKMGRQFAALQAKFPGKT